MSSSRVPDGLDALCHDIDYVMNKIDFEAALQYVGDCVKSGKRKAFIMGEAAAEAFSVSGKAVAGLVENTINRPVRALKQLETLNTKMEKMSDKIARNTKHLAHFLSEHEFYRNVVVEVDKLMHLLRDVYTYLTQETIDNFKEYYANHKPHNITLDIMKRLNHEVTNPLVTSTNEDPLRSRDLMRAWKTVIHNLLASLNIVYTFHEGLNHREVVLDCPFFDAVYDVHHGLNAFIDSFECDYWPDSVEDIVEDIADNKETSNAEKAEAIREELMNIQTTYDFLVIVYDDCSGFRNHTFKADMANVLEEFHLEGLCIVVYRTNYREKRTDEELEEMMDQLEDRRQCEFYDDKKEGTKAGVAKLFQDVPLLGFVGVIKSRFDVEVRSTQHDLSWVNDTRSFHNPTIFQEVGNAFKSIFGVEEDRDAVREDVVLITVPHQDDGERRDDKYSLF